MIFINKELPIPLRDRLKQSVCDVVGCLFKVYKNLPCGFPEYIYQEALDIILTEHGISHKKEYVFHPVFRNKPLLSFFKLDFMIECEEGNIIIECKAVESIGDKERHQLFSYLIGTRFPIGIIVNFSSYPKAEIEKYYYDANDNTITPF